MVSTDVAAVPFVTFTVGPPPLTASKKQIGEAVTVGVIERHDKVTSPV
jgi:hypothetical protein